MTDQRIQHDELMVGAGHPSLSDTLNRLVLISVDNDGTHKHWADLKEYGVLGDGSTNENNIIQSVFNSGKDTIYIPSGTYIFTSLTIPSTVKRIYGTGTFKLKDNSAPGSSVTSVFSGSSLAGLIIEGITIDLNKSNNTILPRIYFNDCNDLRIRDAYFKNGYTVRVDNCTDLWFTNNRSEGHDFYGLVCYGGRGIHVHNNELNNNGFAGFAVVGGGPAERGYTWTAHSIGLTFGATSGVGISCTAASNVFASTDIGCHIYTTAVDGKALITGYTSPTIVTVTIDNILSGTSPGTFTLVKYAKDIDVTFNKCIGNTQFGINIDQFNEGVRVVGNACNETTSGDGIIFQTGTFKGVAANNTCLRNFRDGIRVSGDSLGSSTAVTGNTCSLNGTSGIWKGSGIYINAANDCAVSGNVCTDNYEAGIQYLGSNRGTCSSNMCGNRDTTTQLYGIYQTTGGNINFIGNHCFNNGTTNLSILKTAGAQNTWIGNRDDDSTGLGVLGIADVSIYREGTGTLRTPNSLVIDTNITISGQINQFKNKVSAKTSDYTVVATDSGTVFNNAGAGALITFSLPAVSGNTGVEYSFHRINASNALIIDPNGTETIRGGGAGKYISLDTNGAGITLRCVNPGATSWEIVSSYGTITYEP